MSAQGTRRAARATLGRRVLPLAAVALIVGCGSNLEEVDPTPHSIEVSPAGPIYMRAGDTLPLVFTVRDRAGRSVFTHDIDFTLDAPNGAPAQPVGSGLYAYAFVATAPGTTIITASAGGASTVFVVNVLSWPRTALSGPAFGVAARSGLALVTTLDGHTYRIDPETGAIGAIWDYASNYVAFSTDAGEAFVANSVVDLASGAAVRNILGDPNSSCGVISDVVDHPPSYVYVGCSVGVVTASRTNGSVLATLSTPHPVNSLAVHPTRPLLYASATTAGRVYEIDADADALVRELPILGGPQGTVLPGGDEIDVAMEGEHQLEKWDLGVPAATDSLALSTVVNGAGPFDVALNAGGTRLLVSAGNFVMEVNRANLELTRKYWVGGTARRIGVADGVAVVANEGGWVDLLPF